MSKKLLVIQVAALSRPLELPGLAFRETASVFPALTCPVQASFRTATPPSRHGMIANGRFFRSPTKVMFWEQSSQLVEGERIWDAFRNRGGRVGMLFWQQSLGERVDLVLSPAPIHKHHGGMIEDCYSQPAGLYDKLVRVLGEPFKLRHYWGPLASAKAGDWIARATAKVIEDAALAPELLLTYLPSLDYDLQRYGPDSPVSAKAHTAVTKQVRLLIEAAEQHGYEVLIFGDYATGSVSSPVYLNRALREADLLKVRTVGRREYADLYASQAFALVDHEVAHVYVREGVEEVRRVLESLDGVSEVLDRDGQKQLGIDHSNSGELVIVASDGKWFDYRWWNERRSAPDYAAHVDIHNKPGFDPCELFFGRTPMSTGQNPARIRGSHGRVGVDRNVYWASTLEGLGQVRDLIELAGAVKKWLDA